MKYLSLALALALALIAPSHAALRFGCSTLSIQRLDPLVQPGEIPSAHVHQIVGGNNFNATIRTDDVSRGATCTTCAFTEDFSNYWTAVLYFQHRNGSFKRVPLYPNADQNAGQNGGMTIYYTQQDFGSNGNQYVTSFQPGFRMTIGDPQTNTLAGALAHPGLRYTCLETVMTRGRETPYFPKQPCPAGIMAIHHFPSCWDGKNLDSPNHQDHMYNNAKEGFQTGTYPCPASHPIRVPQLAYETLWNTTQFNDPDLWPLDGTQPFYWSTGDNQGYSTHGDYVFGWRDGALQRAMNSSCMFQGCGDGKPLLSQEAEAQNQCSVPLTVTEDTEGWLDALPGRMPA